MEQTIKSVKLTAKNRLKIALEGEVMYGDRLEFEKTNRNPPNAEPTDGLLNAFKLLLPHFLIHIKSNAVKIDADYIKSGKAVKDKKLKDYAITGFSLSGEGDEEKVVLEGKIIEDDKGMPVKTLKIGLYNNEDYPFSGNLVEDLGKVIEEVELFLGGNFKKDPQGVLHLEAVEEDEEDLDGFPTEEEETY